MRLLQWLGSFLWEVKLARYQSSLNGSLEIRCRGGEFFLTSQSTHYAYGGLQDLFLRVFQKLDIEEKSPEKVLILGFGAGSIASILLDKLALDCQIDAVEYDALIVNLGEKYFRTKRFIKHINLVLQDAYSFTDQCTQLYDLVIVDLFQDQEVPRQFQSPRFIENLCRITKTHGSVIFNKITYSGIQKSEFKDLIKLFEQQTGATQSLTYKDNNRIITWKKTGLIQGV